MDRPTCRTCPYWEAIGTCNGTCHEDSPKAVPESILSSGWGGQLRAIWPETGSYEGCGKHPDFLEYIAALKEKTNVRP